MPPAVTHRPRSLGVAWMIVACLLFGVMATAVGTAYQRDPGLSTFVASFMRSVVNLVALYVIAKGRRATLLGDGRWALWARGLFGGVSLIGYFVGLAYLGVGEAAFLNQTSAVWVAALAPWVLGEKTGLLVWVAVLGSMVGVGFLGHPRDLEGDLVGRLAALGSGLFAAGAYLSIRRAGRSNGPIAIVFYFTLVGTFASLAIAIALGVPWPRDPAVYAWLALSGLAATVAQLFMTIAYRHGPAGAVAAAGAAGPVFSTLFGWWWLDQVPDREAFVGMGILVLTGMILPFGARVGPAPGAVLPPVPVRADEEPGDPPPRDPP